MTSEVYQTIRDRRKKKKERKTYRKAVCQMTENEQNIGHGCLVYDSLINNPEQSKYCIITSTKVISDSNLAGKDYHVLFERVSSSGDPRDIELSDIIVKETPTTHDFISHDSGLVLIFIDPRSHQLSHGHGIFHRECSVLKHVPTVASPSEEREKFCYVDGERYKCVETNGVYSLVPNNAGANSHGCFLFERVPGRNKLNVVGIINGNNEQQVTGISPVWLPSSLQEIILEEERKKEEEDRKKKEEEDRKKKEEEEDRKKKEEEDRKKKEEEDRKKKEEEHRKKEEKDGKKKEEEDRKKREEEERKKEEEDMKKQEEDRKKKEEEERRKKEEDIKKQEEDRKKNEKEDRKKGEEEERKKEEEDIKKEEQDRKKEEEDRKKEEEDGNRKEKTDGPPGSSNGEISPKKIPAQDTYSLDSPVQDILKERPELLEGFREAMDKEDVWGNGWKRFYKELGLPAGRETAMEGEGSPTLNVVNGWISKKGRNATVQALLSAVNRSERKGCSRILEKSLGCQLDCVDTPIENVTEKMGSLSAGPREVKFFGDLDDCQATLISSTLGKNAETLLRTELGKGLSQNNISTKELILQSKMYPIRKYTNLLVGSDREKAIKALRDALPCKGVTGPLLPPNTLIADVRYTCRRNLTMSLTADNHWKSLAEILEMDNTSVKYYNSRTKNPADEVLSFWQVKANSTVGVLYDILVDTMGCPVIADIL